MEKVFDFSRYVTSFLTDYLIGEKGLSNNTVKSYSFTFLLLVKYMKEEKRIEANRLAIGNMTADNIVGFLDWLQNERKCGAATRNQRLAAIAAFARFVQYKCPEALYDCQRILAVPAKKSEEKIVSYLTVDGIKLLLRQPDRTTIRGKRDLALVSLMYESAARVQEVIDLTPSSLRIDSTPHCIVLHGKGDRNRLVPIPEDQVVVLREYMKRTGTDKRENHGKPLFPNPRNRKMTRNGMNNVLVKYVELARKKNPALIPLGISCHSIRHSKAMALLEAGVELMHIRDFLGHRSVLTTERYARVNPKFTFEAVKNAYADISGELPMWEGDDGLIERLRELSR